MNEANLFTAEQMQNEINTGNNGRLEVTCLGIKFKDDDERREHFRNILREKLPELKKIEGYPIGEDEDIIALSDPPYYTACPNPWLNEFTEEWENEKANIKDRKADFTVDEPYASDVSEGKNNPIYNAHSYHTKVPHPAIMRYILHYTQPGDIVFDGFAGTGMTGVAAQMCGNPDAKLKAKIEIEWKELFGTKPVWGARKAILGDLSPIASFIAYNYNTPVDVQAFEIEAKRILAEAEEECGWMYTTLHCPSLHNAISQNNKARIGQLKEQFEQVEKIVIDELKSASDPGKVLTQECFDAAAAKAGLPKGFVKPGRINYTVWSDVFICPNCGSEIVFWDAAVDHEEGKVLDEFKCGSCGSLTTKRKVEKCWVTSFDKALGQTIRQTKTMPVMINYSSGKTRTEKQVSAFDRALIDEIESIDIPYWFPTDKLPDGYNTRQPIESNGITHVHHFYTKRNLIIQSCLKKNIGINSQLQLVYNSISQGLTSKLVRYNLGNRGNGILNGTLYISSLTAEGDILKIFLGKFNDFMKAFISRSRNVLYVNSASSLFNQKANLIDYIFTDPPFGANIMYSELNFLWESWLKVKTNNKTEAIENKVQGKSMLDYQALMTECFKEYFRILKPGKWMTVEFSNTSAAVWNGIQTSLQRAGFVIANVASLDKQQGSFKAVTTPTAVKQDLVISCYKPSSEFEIKIKQEPSEISLWDFVEEHLHHLPVHVHKTQKTTAVIERNPKILYDRMITFYIMRGMPVPIDAVDFQAGLRQKFSERDGMFFTSEQAAQYEDEKRKLGLPEQYTLCFDIIYSEGEAIQWLRNRLEGNPQTYQDIMSDFRKANAAVRKGELQLELKTILEENFIQTDSGAWRVPDMNEMKDREALRTKALLKEFDKYADELASGKIKKLKEVRAEALYAGFKNCWEKKDFNTIVLVAEKIPQNILLEDEQLLMYYDIAKDRI